ncbi:uncharacterized protein FSUBG_12012 [Fusarium subglutinans]|uniref:Uncharacterized protein n=1 Tax=Gibberella subglutinans TaxID=42677 RepID=A0A8H5L9Z0_GIBSU|nr:uncharacterized protein FSUBG_12012 [Fusarium subglutinans]KAF5586801.1 hypothetical protein FSUBG_12012 [Fusarium subglutinans]
MTSQADPPVVPPADISIDVALEEPDDDDAVTDEQPVDPPLGFPTATRVGRTVLVSWYNAYIRAWTTWGRLAPPRQALHQTPLLSFLVVALNLTAISAASQATKVATKPNRLQASIPSTLAKCQHLPLSGNTSKGSEHPNRSATTQQLVQESLPEWPTAGRNSVVDPCKLKASPKHRDYRMNELVKMNQKLQQQIETYNYVLEISVERNETLHAKNESLKCQLAAWETAAWETRSRSV